MKISRYTLLTILGWFSITGCNVLDQEPVSQLTQATFWKTADHAQAGLVACYDQLQNALGNDGNLIHWGEGRADAVDIGFGSGSAEQALIRNTLDPNTGRTNWAPLYTGIGRCNSVITFVPQISDPALRPDIREQIIGQAYFLRAYFYFYVVRLWGDAPLVLQPYTSPSQDFQLSRTGAEAILDRIEDDLRQAESRVAVQYATPNLTRGRATLGAVHGMQARVALWRKKYDEVLRTTDLVMNSALYELVPLYASIFNTRNTRESIFELQYDFARQEINGMRLLVVTGATLGGGHAYRPSAKIKNAYETGDVRRAATIVEGETTLGDYVIKYFGSTAAGSTLRIFDSNIPLIRMADILLMRAEALNQLDRKGEAIALLDRVRRRASLPNTTLTESASTQELETAILQERFIELSFEGHRWFDLVRTGRAIQELSYKPNPITDPRALLWPISIDEIRLNPNLVQNEFYR